MSSQNQLNLSEVYHMIKKISVTRLNTKSLGQ